MLNPLFRGQRPAKGDPPHIVMMPNLIRKSIFFLVLGSIGLLALSICRSRPSPQTVSPTPSTPASSPIPSSPSALLLRLLEPLPSSPGPLIWPRANGLWITDPQGRTLWRVDREAIAGLWSPDRRFLALARPDPAHPELLLLDLLVPQAGERRRFPHVRLSRMGGLAWSPATGSLQLWFVPPERPMCLARVDPETGQRHADLCFGSAGETQAIQGLAAMPDGRLIFATHNADGWWTIHWLDPVTEQIRSYPIPVESPTPEAVRIRLLPSPAGQDVAILVDTEIPGSLQGLHLLDLEVEKLQLFLPSPRPREAIWSPDGQRLLLIRIDERTGRIRGWMRVDLRNPSMPTFSMETPQLPGEDPWLPFYPGLFPQTPDWTNEGASLLPLAWEPDPTGRMDRVLFGWEGLAEDPVRRLGRLVWFTVPGGRFAGFAGLLGENFEAWPRFSLPEAALSVRYPPGWIPRELPADDRTIRHIRFVPPFYAAYPIAEAPGIDWILYRTPITGTLEDWATRHELGRRLLPTAASGLPAFHVQREGDPAEETWIAAGVYGVGLGFTDRGAIDLGSAFLAMRETIAFPPTTLPPGLIGWEMESQRLWRIDLDGQVRDIARLPSLSMQSLPPDFHMEFVRLSHDGRFLWGIWGGDLYEWDLQQNTLRNLTWDIPAPVIAAHEWPARPDWLILEVQSEGSPPPGLALAAIRRDGTDYRILDPEARFANQAAPGQDERTIAYVRDGAPMLYIWERGLVPIDGFPMEWGGMKREYVSHPLWSPDGRRLAWLAVARGGGRAQSAIVIVDLKDRHPRVLPLWTVPESSLTFPKTPPVPQEMAWSPDGRWIALFVPYSDPAYTGVWVLHTDGQERRHLFATLWGRILWSPREPLLLALRWGWDGQGKAVLVEIGSWRIREAPWPPAGGPIAWR